ncbi:hypothetical protein PMNALOAF_2738 [Methylobacterium adhaesivum]|nr:hypothetical protein PMNALOAF_2738 [Methylobacterium adhaesivum]
MRVLGLPLFGVILPFVGRRTVPLNRDGSFVDTGLDDLTDERGPYFVRPFVVEWLGFGLPLTGSLVFDTLTGEAIDPPWECL